MKQQEKAWKAGRKFGFFYLICGTLFLGGIVILSGHPLAYAYGGFFIGYGLRAVIFKEII